MIFGAQQYTGILARASKIGSKLYRHLSGRYKRRGVYWQLTAWAMQLLKDEWEEADIIAELLPTIPGYRPQKCLQSVSPPSSGGLLVHPKGQFYFITSLYKRLLEITVQPAATICMPCIFGAGRRRAPQKNNPPDLSERLLLFDPSGK